jgi:hypothetical protein
MSVIESAVQEINTELLKQLASEIAPEIEQGEITASMLVESAHCSFIKAKKILNGKVASGLMTCRQVRDHGHLTTAYRLIKPVE